MWLSKVQSMLVQFITPHDNKLDYKFKRGKLVLA